MPEHQTAHQTERVTMGFDLKKLIGTVAPTLATALGGPLAGVAAGAIADALGLDDKSDDAIEAALANAKPEDLLKIKQAEQQFKLDMKKLELRPEELEVEDRAGARAMYAATKDGLLPWLAVGVVGTFCAVTSLLLLGYMKVEAVIGGTLIGYLSAKAEQVLSFYFGSTKASRGKDQALADAIAKYKR
jgi:hypothetical protein